MDRVPLTDRQRAVLDYLAAFVAEHGYAPSLQEIAQEFKISSLQGVKDHLAALERKGYLRRFPGLHRVIELLSDPKLSPQGIPILGRIAAGTPLLAVEHIEGWLPLDRSMLGRGRYFALRVKGDSMIGARIFDGDYAIVRQQDHADSGAIVVALLGEETTVKYLRKRGRQWVLEAAHSAYAPIPVEGHSPPPLIQGQVIATYRPVGAPTAESQGRAGAMRWVREASHGGMGDAHTP